jgi:CD2 antigen cytoplasmic tail-binding protein 2
MSKPTKKRVSFGDVQTRIIPAREMIAQDDDTFFSTSSSSTTTTTPTATTSSFSSEESQPPPTDLSSLSAEELMNLSAADRRILKSDRLESRVASKILGDNKFNQSGEQHANGNDDDSNGVRGELTGVDVPTSDDFGYVVEAFNLKEERETGLLRAARNTTLAGKGEDEDHEEDRWLKDNDVMDKKMLNRMKVKELKREEIENERRKKTDQSWLEEIIQLLVHSNETVPMGLQRLRPSKVKSKSGGWRNRQQKFQSASNSHETTTSTTTTTATKSSFEHLTEASSELMARGYDDVYIITKQQMEDKLNEVKEEQRIKSNNKRLASNSRSSGGGDDTTTLPSIKKRRVEAAAATTTTTTTPCSWYYKRKLEDREVHGPFSSENMLAWKNLGYFVGDNVVYLRRDPPAVSSNSVSAPTNDLDDLMNDLNDDNDEVDGSGDTFEWFSSENCAFE